MWINNLTIRARLVILAVSMSGLLIAIGLMGLRNTQQSNEVLMRVYESRVVPIRSLRVIGESYSNTIADAFTRAQNQDIPLSEASESLARARKVVDLEWLELKRLPREMEPELQLLLEDLESSTDRADEALSQVRGLLQANDVEGLRNFNSTQLYQIVTPISNKIGELVDSLLASTKRDYELAAEGFRVQRNWAVLLIVGGILATFGAIIGLGESISKSLGLVSTSLEEMASREADLTKRIVIQRSDEIADVTCNFNFFMDKLLTLVRRVKHSGIDVTASVTAISSTSRQLEQTAKDFGIFTNQVGATAKEISATSQELVKTMGDVSGVAQNTAGLATEGQQGLVAMEKTMSQMEDAAKSISGKLAVISDKAANITTVVTTITKIADQTNLLSLNASIEAEKAGEYGLGFAVVAREIRRLADQVALATLDIEQMVSEMKSAVSAGVMEMDRFSAEVRKDVKEVRSATGQLNKIIDQVQALLPRFETVLEGVKAQSEGAQQISDSMIQLSESVEQTNLSIKETNNVASRLSDAAKELQKEVSGFETGDVATSRM